MARTEDFAVGDLVYWDTFAGLVPARVGGTGILREETGFMNTRDGVLIRLTADRKPYRRGEEHVVPATRVVKRSWVRRKKHGTTILEPKRAGNPWARFARPLG